jgi:ribosomal protein S27E
MITADDPSILVTIEVPCPIPDCGSIVYAPHDSDNVRIDCLDCGAALLTRRGIDGAVTLEVTDDDEVTNDLPPPPLGAGRHVAAFDASAQSDDLSLRVE